ncbi:MAG TPA: hypothetical protein EYG16_07120, partial [Deltaproteobacteria bacterium]|nr:hypothetical protein [Deltaproteobacteria bacterium]
MESRGSRSHGPDPRRKNSSHERRQRGRPGGGKPGRPRLQPRGRRQRMSRPGPEFHVISLFPEMFSAASLCGVTGKAVERGLVGLTAHQLRDFTGGSIHPVDDSPYGGGPGMLMKPEPVFAAVEQVSSTAPPGVSVLLTP